MLKKKMKLIGSFLLKNSKLVLPVVIIVAVAVTVLFALKANDARIEKEEDAASTEALIKEEVTAAPVDMDAPLMESTMQELDSLVYTYYNAYALGDIDTIRNISNYLDETEAIRIVAMSEYVELYEDFVIYTKPGPIDNSYLVYVYFKMKVTNFEDRISGMETFYVCTKEDGTLYLNEGEASDVELEYIRNLAMQDDVVELYNRVNVECSDTFLNNEELFYYIQEIVSEVQKATGEALAEPEKDDADMADAEVGEDEIVPEPTQEPATEGSTEPIYAKATTTVNVRSSDSEQADKVDKVTGGTKVEVLEQKVNGWTKVKVNGKEGYIKTEFLQLANAVNNAEVIGTVTATANVNVRMTPNETADRLGVLAGGEVVDLLGKENGWCKINYNGQIGYVKEDFVQ